METAVIPVSENAIAAAAPTGLGARLAAMPTRILVSGAIGVVVLVALLVAMAFSLRTSDHKVLFSNLSEKDGAVVIAKLDQLGVDYKFADGGGSILVPASRVYELRMKLSAAGVNKGSINGYELLDGSSSFGQSDGQQRVQLKRALEGELTRTIQSLSQVQAARVMLAMPQQNGFFREQQKPSASVMLTLRGGRTLDRAQVAGIVHLVSASVPELNPKAVSVLDHTGALISTPPETGSGLDSQQLQYKQQVEANLNKRIYELLEPVVGRDNLRATVTADVDFSQTESTAEEYKPNQGQNASAAVRVQQSSESNNATPQQPTGVPGAATNQPPVPATAPINGASAPLQATQGGAGNNSSRRDASTQYELDKTVRVTRNATGNLRRLNAAVVVNHRTTVDPKGKSTSAALPQAELDKLNELVKEALGFNADRGDSVKVVSAPFIQEKIDVVEVPVWKQPWLLDLLRAAVVPAALVIVALIAVFGMVRPAIRAVNPPAPEVVAGADTAGNQLNAVVDDENALPDGMVQLPQLEAPLHNEKLERARQLARENPVAVANIMRDWIAGTA